MDINDIPHWKVIKTLIYSVHPNGNLAECGLQCLEEICRNDFPQAYNIIINDTYMHDCFSGTEGAQQTRRVTDEVQVVVGIGGFSLKGFTISGSNPPEHLSNDQKSVVLVAGLK